MIRTQVKLYFIILIILIVSLFVSSWSLFKQEEKITQLKKQRFEFYELVNNLENNHNDFNYIVNRYIVNDNENFEQLLKPFIGITSLENIVNIRRGVLKEFGLNIKSSSMNDFNKQEYQEFFKKINVSPQIYYEIQKADKNALEVLKLNIEALNVYNGFIQKSNNGYVIKVKPNKKKAIDILYSHKYKILNKEIRKTAYNLEEYIQTMMYDRIEMKKKTQHLYVQIDLFLLGLIGFMILFGVFYSNHKIASPLNKLIAWTKQVEKGNYDLDNKETVKNEIGILMHSFDSMAQKVKEDMHLLEKASLTDQLTKLYNRRALDNQLEEIYTNFQRYKTPFSVIIVDIDFFKKVNDTYGHDVGDSVLKEFAVILRTGVRQVDIVGRWGGEEFLVLCPNTNHAGAKVVAENLRKAIETYSFKDVGHKTASLGTAEIQEGMTIAQVIEKSDEALYYAKENGRNQVV